ncbi:MAG: preprotein translocase subunit SecG [Caldilineaceae bacterium]|nr:preprotein translocase subunit SecG [Caldilineaceae bacterium]
MALLDFMLVAIVVLAVALVAIILVQAQDAGLGSMFGGDSSIYRTRRGLEKVVFNVTIALATSFMLLSLLTVILQNRL